MNRTQKRKRRRAAPVRPAITSSPVQETPKRRLRSSYVILGSVGTLFAGLCLYGVVRDRDRTCVDANNYVVSDRQCQGGTTGFGAGRWYYGGNNDGGKMTGGSFERGGFGGRSGGGS